MFTIESKKYLYRNLKNNTAGNKDCLLNEREKGSVVVKRSDQHRKMKKVVAATFVR